MPVSLSPHPAMTNGTLELHCDLQQKGQHRANGLPRDPQEASPASASNLNRARVMHRGRVVPTCTSARRRTAPLSSSTSAASTAASRGA